MSETVVNQDVVKALTALKDRPGTETSQEGRREYVRITWTDRKDPPMHHCFWAFSNKQFEQGLRNTGLKEAYEKGEVKLKQAVNGLIGTQEGLDEYFRALKERTAAERAEIREKCTPQDVYEVEYNNYECMYDWDGDLRALGKVLDWFDEEAVRAVKRRGWNGDIDGMLERLKKGEQLSQPIKK
ncbi:MAG: hypothetical protein II841_04760 [Bacteroidales bacterium]|nr:hypothetical protein [Bacteroidales bacterium]